MLVRPSLAYCHRLGRPRLSYAQQRRFTMVLQRNDLTSQEATMYIKGKQWMAKLMFVPGFIGNSSQPSHFEHWLNSHNTLVTNKGWGENAYAWHWDSSVAGSLRTNARSINLPANPLVDKFSIRCEICNVSVQRHKSISLAPCYLPPCVEHCKCPMASLNFTRT